MISKADLRAAARARRAKLAASAPHFAQMLARYAGDLPLQPAAAVASYWPSRNEADPRLLAAKLYRLGHPILLPKVDGLNEPLSFRLWREGDMLEVTAHNVSEPSSSAPVGVPDAVLVPLLAFDARGYRLGYGGGYYDRTLMALRRRGPILVVGVAYAAQEVSSLPSDSHDERLDMIATENGLRRLP